MKATNDETQTIYDYQQIIRLIIKMTNEKWKSRQALWPIMSSCDGCIALPIELREAFCCSL